MAMRRFLACVVALVLCFLPLWTAAGELTSLDIGGAEPGSTRRAGDGYEITGGGKDIWDESDAFRFVFQRVSGDCEVRALVVSQQNTHLWAKSGVMVRQSTAPGAMHAMLVTSPQPRVAFELRAGTDGMSKNSICKTEPLPQWLRLVRSKQSIVAYVAADKAGTDWQLVGTQDLELTDPILIGLCVTSHEPGKLSTAVFQHVALVVLPAGPEAAPNRTSAEVAESEAKPRDRKLAAALAASAAKLSSEGKAEKSRQLCFAALAQDEDCAEALYELAKAFEQDGKTTTARDFLFRAAQQFAKGEAGNPAFAIKRLEAERRLATLNPYAMRLAGILADYTQELNAIVKKTPDTLTLEEACDRADMLNLRTALPPDKGPKFERPEAPKPPMPPPSVTDPSVPDRTPTSRVPFRREAPTSVPPDVERALKAAGWTTITGAWKKKADNVYEVTDGRLESPKLNGGVQAIIHKGGSGSVRLYVRNGLNDTYYSSTSTYTSGFGFGVDGSSVKVFYPHQSGARFYSRLEGTENLSSTAPKNKLAVTINNEGRLDYIINDKVVRHGAYQIPKNGPFVIYVEGTWTIESPQAVGQ